MILTAKTKFIEGLEKHPTESYKVHNILEQQIRDPYSDKTKDLKILFCENVDGSLYLHIEANEKKYTVWPDELFQLMEGILKVSGLEPFKQTEPDVNSKSEEDVEDI